MQLILLPAGNFCNVNEHLPVGKTLLIEGTLYNDVLEIECAMDCCSPTMAQYVAMKRSSIMIDYHQPVELADFDYLKFDHYSIMLETETL